MAKSNKKTPNKSSTPKVALKIKTEFKSSRKKSQPNPIATRCKANKEPSSPKKKYKEKLTQESKSQLKTRNQSKNDSVQNTNKQRKQKNCDVSPCEAKKKKLKNTPKGRNCCIKLCHLSVALTFFI